MGCLKFLALLAFMLLFGYPFLVILGARNSQYDSDEDE